MDDTASPSRTARDTSEPTPEPRFEATMKTEILGFSEPVGPEVEPDTHGGTAEARPRSTRSIEIIGYLLVALGVFIAGAAGIWFVAVQP
ncbi:hypothetical protein [Microbacterium sp. 10M-3C3]|jgi:hypothetical protein|uniref:hypothetical protein n=1 Tax=Microbacterium sp. 10M-3C3 TaxID=2483401 RepID=UPI000F63C18F|nr:hypothetical protein [Microbacterium sp. 10M-3C3]